MREWYSKHLEKKGNRKSRIKLFYIILAFNIFLIFSIIKSRNHSVPMALPSLISQKLTTNLVGKSPEDRLFIVENGGKINYFIEYELLNSGATGFVVLEAELIREDTTLKVSEIVEISSEARIFKKLKFPELEYKALKREYSINVEAIIVEN